MDAIRLLAWCLVAFVLTHLNIGTATGQELVRREVYVMGTTLAIEIDAGSRAAGVLKLEEMFGVVEAAEGELSTWRDTSALSRLNRQEVGAPEVTAASLCRLLGELGHWSDRTGGTFDPAIGALVDAWGLRTVPRIPASWELDEALSRSGFDLVNVDLETCRTTRLGDVWIDAGAFGKGEALDRVAAIAAEEAWMADFGGQIMVHGPARSDSAWTVALAHPAYRDRVVAEVTMSDGSLATSGGSERDAPAAEGRVGHILDPRTGRTLARSESVAVWHDRALVADILSTALYVMGIDDGMEWAEAEGIAVCFLLPDGDEVRLRATTAFRDKFLNTLSDPR